MFEAWRTSAQGHARRYDAAKEEWVAATNGHFLAADVQVWSTAGKAGGSDGPQAQGALLRGLSAALAAQAPPSAVAEVRRREHREKVCGGEDFGPSRELLSTL